MMNKKNIISSCVNNWKSYKVAILYLGTGVQTLAIKPETWITILKPILHKIRLRKDRHGYSYCPFTEQKSIRYMFG